jgi:hypothetical protein
LRGLVDRVFPDTFLQAKIYNSLKELDWSRESQCACIPCCATPSSLLALSRLCCRWSWPLEHHLVLVLVSFDGGMRTESANPLLLATTGGGSATPATPTSNAQLITWLSDSTQRVIVLDKIFDFTSYCTHFHIILFLSIIHPICHQTGRPRVRFVSPGPVRTAILRNMPSMQTIGAHLASESSRSTPVLVNLFFSISPTGTATYYTSGTGNSYDLKVGSKKTLLGKGSNAGM